MHEKSETNKFKSTMKKKNDSIGEFAELIAAMKKEHATKGRFLLSLDNLFQQVQHSNICGSWLACGSNLSAAIRRIGPSSFHAVIYDNTLCYKRVVQDVVISARQQQLTFFTAENPDDLHRVRYDAKTEILFLGCYGTFTPEDVISTYITTEELVEGPACEHPEE